MGLALDLEDYHSSVLLHCWLGHLTCKIVSEMTCNVSNGTLNPTIPYRGAACNMASVGLSPAIRWTGILVKLSLIGSVEYALTSIVALTVT